jgi:hypothetical protein
MRKGDATYAAESPRYQLTHRSCQQINVAAPPGGPANPCTAWPYDHILLVRDCRGHLLWEEAWLELTARLPFAYPCEVVISRRLTLQCFTQGSGTK